MVRVWFSSEKKEEGVTALAAVVGCVRRAVAVAMSCFFGCFRIDDYHRVPQDPMVSRDHNGVSSLFIYDDGNGDEGPLPEDLDIKELKDEAKFLKACGTLSKTPLEIRKATAKWEEKWQDLSAEHADEKSLTSKSWLYNTSTEKLKLGMLTDETPTPVKLSEEWVTGETSLNDTSSSSMTDGYSTSRSSTSSMQSNDIQNVVISIDACDSEICSVTPPVSLLQSRGSISSNQSGDTESSTSSMQSSAIQNVIISIDACDREIRSVTPRVSLSQSRGSISSNQSGDTENSTSSMQSSDIQNVIISIDACDNEIRSVTPLVSLSQSRVSISSNQSGDTESVSKPIDVCDSETQTATPLVPSMVSVPNVQSNIKSVRFQCESDESPFSSRGSSSESSSQHSKQSGSTGSSSVTKLSPYPTPLRITDDMQTPGTVFLNNMAAAKTGRIRSQYVYSVINQPENPSLYKEFMDSDHQSESPDQNDEATLKFTPLSDREIKFLSDGEGMKNEASLSSWLRPPSLKHGGNSNDEQFSSASGESFHNGTTRENLPILGLETDNLKCDKISHNTPRMWEGNGILNSTNKYKEDRKVSWHETPFQERLEKALSAGNFICQRNPISMTLPVKLNGTEKSDTVFSHSQSADHLESES